MRKNLWQRGIVLAVCLILLPVQIALAAVIGDLRSGGNEERTRLVLSTDQLPKYSEAVVGKQLIITFNAEVKKTESINIKDVLVKSAVLENFQNQSRLVIDFYVAAPKYVIFSLKKPNRIVIDFKKISKVKQVTDIAEGVIYT